MMELPVIGTHKQKRKHQISSVFLHHSSQQFQQPELVSSIISGCCNNLWSLLQCTNSCFLPPASSVLFPTSCYLLSTTSFLLPSSSFLCPHASQLQLMLQQTSQAPQLLMLGNASPCRAFQTEDLCQQVTAAPSPLPSSLSSSVAITSCPPVCHADSCRLEGSGSGSGLGLWWCSLRSWSSRERAQLQKRLHTQESCSSVLHY